MERELAGLRALVLGGTGLIGSHIVRSLHRRGCEVRVLTRGDPAVSPPALRGLPVDLVRGDLADPESVRSSLVGVDLLFHAAAPYPTRHLGMDAFVRRAVIEMESLLAAARESTPASLHPSFDECRGLPGLKRVIYTSSVTTIGRPRGGGPGRPQAALATESDRYDLARPPSPYFACKQRLEAAVTRAASDGLPAVILNPTLVVDAGDAHLTTGRLLLEVARERMPFYLKGTIDAVAGTDVGEGHVLAAMKGRAGQRYILGHERMSLRRFLGMVCEEAGVAPPRIPCPMALAQTISLATEVVAYLRGARWPLFPMHGIQMLRHAIPVDSSLAVRELGLPQTPVRDAVRRALAWYRAEGLLP